MHRKHVVVSLQDRTVEDSLISSSNSCICAKNMYTRNSVSVGFCARHWNKLEQDGEGACSHRVMSW